MLYFYEYLRFNENNQGKGLQIINNTILKRTLDEYKWSTCTFGKKITKKTCNTMTVHIKWKKCTNDFMMGYVNENINDFDWNESMGLRKNRSISGGIYVYKGNRRLGIYDKENVFKLFRYESTETFKQNDVFKLTFNLNENKFTVHHNEKYVDGWALYNFQQIIPAISLRKINTEIEIIKCKFT